MDEEEIEVEEYKVQANLLKDEGNEAFQSGDVELAISKFTQAIDIDPDNVIFYSNRSAAYMKVDSISKALHDAEKCIELDPKWSKGYNRLGVAQQQLKRFEAAIDTYKKGIELDPDNKALWAALKSCQEAWDADKKMRFSAAAVEREAEDRRLQQRNELKAEIAAAKARQKAADEEDLLAGFLSEVSPSVEQTDAVEEEVPPVQGTAEEDDLLAGFFNDVSSAATAVTKAPRVGGESDAAVEEPVKKELTEKYTNQDLGDGRAQHERITGRHSEWRNLNPYYVLGLGVDATEEDVKLRYKKLSLKVHPDRLRDVPNARDAFEQVKDAYMKICDEAQRKTILAHADNVRDDLQRERRKIMTTKGVAESDLPDFDEEFERRLMKHFAEIERNRQRSEKNLRAYSARDKMQEAEELAKMARFTEFDKSWSEDNRRDKRVGGWRDFQAEPEAKRVKPANFKEEHRTETKHGVVKVETWKKNWK